jgi:protein-L-isoaspartate(D-aspartate) O-methyltransferase
MAAEVVALDNETMIAAARTALADQSGIELVAGDLTTGVPDKAPFDVIIVEGAIEVEPKALIEQLADGGRLVAVVGKGQSGRLMLWTKSGTETGSVALLNAAAPLLKGFTKTPGFAF